MSDSQSSAPSPASPPDFRIPEPIPIPKTKSKLAGVPILSIIYDIRARGLRRRGMRYTNEATAMMRGVRDKLDENTRNRFVQAYASIVELVEQLDDKKGWLPQWVYVEFLNPREYARKTRKFKSKCESWSNSANSGAEVKGILLNIKPSTEEDASGSLTKERSDTASPAGSSTPSDHGPHPGDEIALLNMSDLLDDVLSSKHSEYTELKRTLEDFQVSFALHVSSAPPSAGATVQKAEPDAPSVGSRSNDQETNTNILRDPSGMPIIRDPSGMRIIPGRPPTPESLPLPAERPSRVRVDSDEQVSAAHQRLLSKLSSVPTSAMGRFNFKPASLRSKSPSDTSSDIARTQSPASADSAQSQWSDDLIV